MGLSDPFESTYAGAYKAGSSLGEGIKSTADNVAGNMKLQNQRNQAMNMLKQFGMLKTKTEEPSLDELAQGAKDFAKSQGHELNINYGDNPEQAKQNIMGIYKALNIPMPQGKTTTELNLSPGTEYDPIKGDVSFKAPADKSPLDALIKMENLKYMQGINKQIDQSSGDGANLVYRDPVTGEEVAKDLAIQNIKEGKGRYVVNQKVTTKAGVKESPVVKPDDLTETEKNYLITADRVKTSLSDLKDTVYPKLDSLGGNKDWQAFQAENVPFIGIKNQDIQDFKSSLTRLKADIPFLRGGKQLTPTEAKRVDILLNPFGKTKETREKDIERFQKEFVTGENLMKYGQAPSMQSGSNVNSSVTNNSFTSEEEAANANLKPGTKITINGRSAIWE